MSEEHRELARRAVLAWNEAEVDAVLPYLDESVEWHPPKESMEPGIYRGHEGVRDYLGRLGQVFTERRIEEVDVTDIDATRVLAGARMLGKSANFGEIDIRFFWLITFREGKATEVRTFLGREEADEAARVPGTLP